MAALRIPSEPREHDIQKAILDYLRTVHGKHGWWWNNKLGAAARGVKHRNTTYTGSADIIGVYYGRHMEFEIKARRGVQSDDQKKHQERIEKAGGRYYLVRSVDEVQKIMGAI